MCEQYICSLPFEGRKRIRMLGNTYPFDKLHNDRVHGTFNMMMSFGGEGPVVRVVFDGGFCLESHDKVLDIGADTVFIKKIEQ